MSAVAFVAGATGFVGRAVVERLKPRARTIAHIRPDSKKQLDGEVARVAWEPAAMTAAVKGATHVFGLLGTTRKQAKAEQIEGDPYEAIDYGLTKLLVDAAVAAGGRPRFVLLSSVGVGPKSSTAYLRAHWKAEEAVRASGLPWIIVRPSIIASAGGGAKREDGRPMEKAAAVAADGVLAVAGLFSSKLRAKYRSTTPERLGDAIVRLALDGEPDRVYEGADLRVIARRFGPLDVDVPVVGLGTWQMEDDDEADVIRAVHRAIELGAIHVDTAEMYGSGRVEQILGKALAGRRDQVFLASKVLPRNAAHDAVIRACERSLRRLDTDHLDLYLLHWRGDVRLAETFGAFEALREAGKIRAWGVSNFDPSDLAEALAAAGPGRIACNQVLYHLGDRTIEHEVIPWCERHQVAVVAYSPFGSAGGFPNRSSPGGKALADVAKPIGATARQVALAYLTRRAFAIPKASRVEHVAENTGAATLALDEVALARLDRAFPRGPWRGLPSL